MEIVLDDVKRVNPIDDAESQRAQLHDDDVVVCITGARTGAVAHVTCLPEATYINQHVCLLRPIPTQIRGRFLAYAMFSFAGVEQLNLSMYGLKQGLGLEQVRKLVTCVPPLREQAEIVGFVDETTARFGALISNAESAIVLLQERRSALISAAVTGKIDVRNLAAGQSEAA